MALHVSLFWSQKKEPQALFENVAGPISLFRVYVYISVNTYWNKVATGHFEQKSA